MLVRPAVETTRNMKRFFAGGTRHGVWIFGLWRAWQAWDADAGDGSWLAAAGFSGSLAAGALVLGYYLAFWAGLWVFARNAAVGRSR